MGPKKCEVCEDAQSKYKCPSCLIAYCSLPCFKKHKEIPCQKVDSLKEEKVYPISTTNDDRPSYVDEQSEVLQESQLQSVASCDEIRSLIKNEKLQKLIYNIDSSADPESELDKAMEEESFRLCMRLSLLDPWAGHTFGLSLIARLQSRSLLAVGEIYHGGLGPAGQSLKLHVDRSPSVHHTSFERGTLLRID